MAWTLEGSLKGPPGSAGGPGSAGPPGENAFTTTTANFTVPGSGATTTVTVADASFIVPGQMVWIDTAGGGPGKAGELQVQSIAGSTVTLLNVGV